MTYLHGFCPLYDIHDKKKYSFHVNLMQSVFKSTTHAVTSYYHRLCVCAVAVCASTRECVRVFAVLQRPPPLNRFYKSSGSVCG